MRKERINGPYKHGRRWRIVHVARNGTQTTESFKRRKDAEAKARAARKGLEREKVTVGLLMIDYLAYKLRKGNRASTVTTTAHRLRAFFDEEESASRITRRRAQQLYDDYADSGVSVATHRNTLSQVKTFARWCIKQGVWNKNPFEEVEGVGRKRTGKPQLNADEARKFVDFLLERDGPGATAVLLCLLLGLRASEVCAIRGRDVAGGTLGLVGAKTARGNRKILVPEMLLRRIDDLRGPDAGARIFGGDRAWLRRQSIRLAGLAGVPRVSPHGLRGTHASLCAEVGMTGHVVASALGHASYSTTAAHYARPEAIAQGRTEMVLRVLEGGK